MATHRTKQPGRSSILFQLPGAPPSPRTRELLRRLNEIEGIEPAEAKLVLRPSFPLQAFAEHGEEVGAVLEWFAHTAVVDPARRV
ncbi:hypothetical protein ACFVUH_36775 [Kitasatospora sp. NPDC058032]|uniref:hypothetical protein n=1 Tax=Kitasatospora sp. NPDC058032 TaxID=3346307 RepID=UPI0036D77301